MNTTDFDVRDMSQEELDRIALEKNSTIGRISEHNEVLRADVSDYAVGDWRFNWIATRGSERRGILILKPTNRRTKSLVIQGRARWISDRWGVDSYEASRIIAACRGIPHVNEERTMSLIVKSYNHKAMWDSYFEGKHSVQYLRDWYGDAYPEFRRLNDVKIESVIQVIKRLTGREAIAPSPTRLRMPWGRHKGSQAHS